MLALLGIFFLSPPASAEPENTSAKVAAAVSPMMRAGSGDLPTGDDGAYRRAMLAWNASPRPAGRFATTHELLAMPVAHTGRVSSYFGVRADPLGQGHRMHSGIDIPGPLGTSVMATGAGVVVFAGRDGGYGNLVVIDHGNGVRTRYGHLLRSLVVVGDTVDAGSAIGLMGSTGRSTGPHLHYEVRIGGVAVNPLRFQLGVKSFAFAPPLPPIVPVVPHWRGWAPIAAGDQLPMAVIR